MNPAQTPSWHRHETVRKRRVESAEQYATGKRRKTIQVLQESVAKIPNNPNACLLGIPVELRLQILSYLPWPDMDLITHRTSLTKQYAYPGSYAHEHYLNDEPAEDKEPVMANALGDVQWTDGRPLSFDDLRIARRLRAEGRTQPIIFSGPRFGAASGSQVCDTETSR